MNLRMIVAPSTTAWDASRTRFKYSVLAHQVFVRGDFPLVFVLLTLFSLLAKCEERYRSYRSGTKDWP